MDNLTSFIGSIVGSQLGMLVLGAIIMLVVLTLAPQRFTDAVTRKDRFGVFLMVLALIVGVVGFFPTITLNQILGIAGVVGLFFLGRALSTRGRRGQTYHPPSRPVHPAPTTAGHTSSSTTGTPPVTP